MYLRAYQRERDQAEEIEVGGARSAPAAEQDVEADDEVDETDDAQALGQAAVKGIGNDLDGRVEGNAVAGDGVVDLAVGAGAVEGAFEVGESRDRVVVARGAVGDPGEQVMA